MRLIAAAMLVLSMLALSFAPAANACRISLWDPTDPEMSSDCTEIRDVSDAHVELDSTYAVDRIDGETGLCSQATRVCDAFLRTNLDVAMDEPGAYQTLRLNLTADGYDGSRVLNATYDDGRCSLTLNLPSDLPVEPGCPT